MFASGINKNVKKFAPKVSGRRKPGAALTPAPPTAPQTPAPAAIPSSDIDLTPTSISASNRGSETPALTPTPEQAPRFPTPSIYVLTAAHSEVSTPSISSVTPILFPTAPTVVTEESADEVPAVVNSVPRIRSTGVVASPVIPADDESLPRLTAPPTIRVTNSGIPRIQTTTTTKIRVTTKEIVYDKTEDSTRRGSDQGGENQVDSGQEIECEHLDSGGDNNGDYFPLAPKESSINATADSYGLRNGAGNAAEREQYDEAQQAESSAAAVKKPSARKRAAASTKPLKSKKAKTAHQAIVEEPNGEPTGPSVAASSAKAKKPKASRKARGPKTRAITSTDPVKPQTECPADGPANGEESITPTSERRRGRHRSLTPPNSENIQIVPSVIKMSDLCRDIKTGKKSKRFTELEKMDWTEIVRKQRAKKAEIEAAKAAGETVPAPETVEQRIERMAAEHRPAPAPQRHAMQVRVVDGQIVLDEETLTIDRRDHIEEAPTELVEETSLTRKVNSATWGSREKAERWDEESTNKFYEALSMFGTDFELISRLFSDRSRRQMKNKFNAEERRNPARVTQALRNRIAVDLEAYAEATATTYADPAILAEELENLRSQHAAEEAAAKEAAKELERERREQADAELHAENNPDNERADNTTSGEGGKRKRGKKGGSAGQFISRHTGGGEVILGTI